MKFSSKILPNNNKISDEVDSFKQITIILSLIEIKTYALRIANY